MMRREKHLKRITTVSQINEQKAAPYLPEEIVINILNRVQARSLHYNLRYVCRLWSNVISDPLFVKRHLLQSTPGFIIQEVTKIAGHQFVMHFIEIKECGKIEVQELDRGYMVGAKACCNGLVVLQHILRHEQIYITNPITKQWAMLPPCTSSEFSSFGLAVDHSSREYKVVNVYVDEGAIGCEILALGGCFNYTWRDVDVPVSDLQHWHCDPPILIDGVLHWDVKSSDCIASVDVSDEKFRWTHLPNLTVKDGHLLQLGGFLSFVNRLSPFKMDVWILKDLCKAEWIKQHSIVLHCERYCGDVTPIMSLRNGEVIIFSRPVGSLYAYDVKLKQEREIEIKVNDKDLIFCGAHVNSLISWKNSW